MSKHYHIWAGRMNGRTAKVQALFEIAQAYRTRQAAHQAAQTMEGRHTNSRGAFDDYIIRECKQEFCRHNRKEE